MTYTVSIDTPDWLLACEPRQVQLEALCRSYAGFALFDAKDGEPNERKLGHFGQPAKGWNHFMEMRLGKTPTALNEFMLLKRDHGINKMIVLTPNKFKLDWPLEAEKFGVDVPVAAFESERRKEAAKFISNSEFLLAVNYEALIQKPTLELLETACDDHTCIVADESITLKGHSSKIFKGAMSLAKNCAVRRNLSGKPVTQGAHDLWSQLRFINQIEGFNYFAFRNAFCEMGGFKGKQVLGIKNEKRLQGILDACSFKARKIDWLKTPGVDYAVRRIELHSNLQRMYTEMQDEFILELQSGDVVAADQIITKLMKMQQISSGFIYDEKGEVHQLVPVDKNTKINEIISILEEELTTKLIIVCHYRHSIFMLGEALAKFNPAFIMRGVDVISEKTRFNDDRSCRVVIGQEQAVRYGHTLMGNKNDPCFTTVFFENNYSLNDRSQCEERNQGEGQQQPITIIDFICTDKDMETIESLQRKEDVAAALLKYDRSTGVLPRNLS